MTVSQIASTVVYDGNGVTTQFDVPWPFAASSDIRVVYQSAPGELNETLILNTDYAITGDLVAGFKVNFAGLMGAPASGSKIVVSRREAALQTTPFNDNARFPAARVAAMGDKLARAIQDVKDEQGLFFRLSDSDLGRLGPLPPLSGAVGKFFTFVDDPANPGDYLVSFSPSVAAVEATAAIAAQILTVANISASVVIVAAGANPANIATVAGSIASVNTTAGSIANVNIVAGSIASVNTTAGSIANVNIVAGSIASVNTTAGSIANVNIVAADLALGAGSFILAAPAAAATATAKAAEAAAWTNAAVDQPVEGVSGDKIVFNPATAVNITTNIVTIAAHGLRNWQQIRYRHGGGTVIGGLTQDANFWAEVVDASTFKLSATRYGATIDLTSVGTGTAHEFLPLRSAKHHAAYAEQDAITSEAASLSATDILATAQILIKPGTYASAAAVVAAFPSDPAPYFFMLTTGEVHVLTDVSPPTSSAYEPAVNADVTTRIVVSYAALKALVDADLPSRIKTVLMEGWLATVYGGGAFFEVLRGSAASFGVTADDVLIVENTAQTLTFRRIHHGLGVNLASIGVKYGRSLVQADYQANDTAFSRWQNAKALGLCEGMAGFWTAKNPTDGFKAHGAGNFMPVVLTGDPQTEARANAMGLFYAGGSTTDAFLWLAHSAQGVEPSGTDINIEGLDLRGVHIDGGAAKYAFVGVRCGYGASADKLSLTGGSDVSLVLQGAYAVKWGEISISRCPNIGASIGENRLGFANDIYCFDVRMTLNVTYAGYDSAGTKLVDYTVVRATLTAPDGSETAGGNAAETRAYLVASAGATGAFAGQENKVAYYNPTGSADALGRPSGWSFETRASGAIVYDMTANNALLSNGTTWSVDNTKIEKGAGVIFLSMRQAGGFSITSVERCAGWGAIMGSRQDTGPMNAEIDYAERNAGGLLFAYENKSRAPKVRFAFPNPGSGHPEQSICIRGQTSVAGHTSTWLSGATPLDDAGPADEAHYLVLEGIHGVNSADSDGISIYSNTGKYFVYAPDASIHYGAKVPRNYADPAQVALYVNASTGHDAYTGESGKPLKTLGEALRRRRYNANIATINLAGNFTGQSVDLGGQQGGTVVVDGGGTANLNQSGDNIAALIARGKGCRLKLQNFASIGKVETYNADVEIQGSITAASTAAAAHYGLWVDEDSNVTLVGSVNADAARGIRVDGSRLVIYGTVTNYAAGLAVVCNDNAEIVSNALAGDANALNLIGGNASSGAGVEGFCRFKDGAVWSYELADFGGAHYGTATATLTGETTAGTTGNTGTINWTRVGKLVIAEFDINTTTFDGTGNLYIDLGSLPVADHRTVANDIENWRVAATGKNFRIYGVIEAASNNINLYREDTDGTTDNVASRLVDTDLSGAAGSWDARFVGQFIYRAQ